MENTCTQGGCALQRFRGSGVGWCWGRAAPVREGPGGRVLALVFGPGCPDPGVDSACFERPFFGWVLGPLTVVKKWRAGAVCRSWAKGTQIPTRQTQKSPTASIWTLFQHDFASFGGFLTRPPWGVCRCLGESTDICRWNQTPAARFRYLQPGPDTCRQFPNTSNVHPDRHKPHPDPEKLAQTPAKVPPRQALHWPGPTNAAQTPNVWRAPRV